MFDKELYYAGVLHVGPLNISQATSVLLRLQEDPLITTLLCPPSNLWVIEMVVGTCPDVSVKWSVWSETSSVQFPSELGTHLSTV
ncbi:hypothetical protein TNCV_4927371 [Trichonephila clavipes]|nr:hypothetical protein TNCV_4927371 [Trichonephila clavipes]